MEFEIDTPILGGDDTKISAPKDMQREETRRNIMEAASQRFMHYGYQKTTMAEIARDLDMSAGNLYRYFPSKIDIAEEIALAHEGEEHALKQAIVRNGADAISRLRALMHQHLEHTFQMIAESHKVFEVARAIGQERPDFVQRRLKIEAGFITAILDDGVRTGQLRPDLDSASMAATIQAACFKFQYPQLWNCKHLSILRQELDAVLDVLLTGIARKAA